MPQTPELVYSSFDRACERWPERTAVIYLGQRFSYRRMRELIDRFAAALHAHGVRPGERIMIYLPNLPQFLIAYFGAQVAGAVPVPVSPIYTPHEIRYLLNDTGAKTVVCLDTNYRYVKEVWPETSLKRVIVTTHDEMLPAYKRLFGWMFDLVPRGTTEKGESLHRFGALLRQYPPRPPQVEVDPIDHPCYILYTGGTTGFPKGCVMSHSGMVSFVEEIREVGEGFIRDEEEVFVMVNPLFHQLAQGVLLGMVLSRGNTCILMPIPQVDAILDAIERHRATLFLGAPTLYRMILENDRLDLFDLHSLRYCWSGGDVLPLETFERWKRLLGIPIYQAYGATEVGFTCMSPLGREPVPGSIGMPLPSREVMIVDHETLEPVDDGEPGELLVTFRHISDGYWRKPDETAKAYVDIESRRWYRMNDFVRRDETGLLYYVDRSADIIKCKGYRVSASEIESCLLDHEAVIEACVVGVPDKKLGERIKAIVVLKQDARGVSGADLTRWCRDRLAEYKIPQYIEFRDMLPKSKVGKLLRRDIRDEERRKMKK
ncbi:putative long-chain-fatty-acid--CoA ligase [uncultured Desulfatiglans sp.]|nr:putative long-chain-fatty-acid--CoA ligase [uncultured Desulfatiglans sp.]